MIRPRSLSRDDYGIASRIMRELSQPDLSHDDLVDLTTELMPVFDAQDISLVLNDPSEAAGEPISVWFRDFGADEMRQLVADCPEGNLGFRVFRRSGLRTCRIRDLHQADLMRLLESDFYRQFRDRSRLQHCLVTHLGTRPQESLGRIGYYRGDDRPDFDDERLTLLRMLHPELSAAARRLVASRMTHEEEEVALINAAGQLLWMTEGFRFLWNAVDESRIDYGRLSIHDLMAGGRLSRALAFHVIDLGMPAGTSRCAWYLCVPYRASRGTVEIRFALDSGEHFGCSGRVLRVALIRTPYAVRVTPPAPVAAT